MRLPIYYGWVIVAVVFVTMGVGVNARTAFSLLFPPILAEFGWERGVTAGAFSFGFLVSAALSPSLGRLMDRRGPRVVIELGVLLIGAGLLLATLVTRPWHLYATLGVMVGGGSVCLGYTGQSLFLPDWFVRRRGLAMSLAFSGVGVGSIDPAALAADPDRRARAGAPRAGRWASSCCCSWSRSICCCAAGPQDMGLEPDGDRAAAARRGGRARPTWWTRRGRRWTGRSPARRARPASGGSRVGYFCGLFAWYAVQVHQTKYLIEIGFSPTDAAWALGFVSLAGIPGQIALGQLSDRIGREWVWTVGALGFAICYAALLLLAVTPTPALL